MINYFFRLWINSGVKCPSLFSSLSRLSLNWVHILGYIKGWVSVSKGFTKKVVDLIYKMNFSMDWS